MYYANLSSISNPNVTVVRTIRTGLYSDTALKILQFVQTFYCSSPHFTRPSKLLWKVSEIVHDSNGEVVLNILEDKLDRYSYYSYKHWLSRKDYDDTYIKNWIANKLKYAIICMSHKIMVHANETNTIGISDVYGNSVPVDEFWSRSNIGSFEMFPFKINEAHYLYDTLLNKKRSIKSAEYSPELREKIHGKPNDPITAEMINHSNNEIKRLKTEREEMLDKLHNELDEEIKVLRKKFFEKSEKLKLEYNGKIEALKTEMLEMAQLSGCVNVDTTFNV